MSMSSGSLLVAEPRSFYIVEPSSPQWIEVLVNSPWGQELCIYSISPDLMVQPGDIVSVPFGKQIMGGIAIDMLILFLNISIMIKLKRLMMSLFLDFLQKIIFNC